VGIKQSVCLPIIQTEMSKDAFLGEIKAIGFRAFEIWERQDDFKQLCDLAHKHDLVFCSMVGHQALSDGLNNRDNHARIEDELRENIDLAAANGLSGLICFSGNVREGVPPNESKMITAEGLTRIAPYAEEKGITLNLELLNSKVDHEGYECDHTSWGLDVVKQVNSPRVKLLYDIYHMQIMEGDVIRTIQDTFDYFGHYHTAGITGRHDLDDQQELNYTPIAKVISATGYGGYLGHEFVPKGDPLLALRQAFEACDV